MTAPPDVLLRPLAPHDSVRTATLEGPPQSKQRARRGKGGHWYTPRATRDAELAAAWQLRRLGRFPANVALACVFYMPTRRPCDGDNLLKLVLDAGTKAGIWHDDRQVTATVAVVEYDPARPRTEVAAGTHSSSMVREAPVTRRGNARHSRQERAGATQRAG